MQANLADLRSERLKLQELVRLQLLQAAERDAQIRMVLEERFYRPVQTAPAEQVPAVQDPVDLNDVTQFDAGSDEDWMRRQDSILAQLKGGGSSGEAG